MKRIVNVAIILVALFALGACKQESVKQENVQKTSLKQPPTAKRIPALAIPESIPEQNDIELRNQFRQEIQELLAQKEFEKLEQMEKELTASKAKFPGGDWKIGRFLEAFRDEDDPEEVWNKHFAVLEQWKRRKPESSLAKLVIADAFVGYGWNARGSGFANEVSDEGFKLFSERLTQAQKVLEELKDDRKKHLNWYNVQDRVARGLGWSSKRYDEFFNEAVEIEPLYWEFYQNKAIVLLPRWHGKPGEWEAFAEASANKIGGDQGHILYAEICWQISRFYSGKEFYEQNRVDWFRIRKGFILLEKYYGASYRYLNAFAIMASAKRDYPATKLLFQRIGENWEPDFWSSKKNYDEWKDWASKIPSRK